VAFLCELAIKLFLKYITLILKEKPLTYFTYISLMKKEPLESTVFTRKYRFYGIPFEQSLKG